MIIKIKKKLTLKKYANYQVQEDNNNRRLRMRIARPRDTFFLCV